jgi:hypothetical protein
MAYLQNEYLNEDLTGQFDDHIFETEDRMTEEMVLKNRNQIPISELQNSMWELYSGMSFFKKFRKIGIK